MSEVFTCARGGWTKRTTIIRINPEDFAERMARLGFKLESVSCGAVAGSTPHGRVEWRADDAVPRGTSEQVQVYE